MGQGSRVNLHKYLKKKSNLKDFSCPYLLFFFCYQLPPSEIWMLSFFFSFVFFPPVWSSEEGLSEERAVV